MCLESYRTRMYEARMVVGKAEGVFSAEKVYRTPPQVFLRVVICRERESCTHGQPSKSAILTYRRHLWILPRQKATPRSIEMSHKHHKHC